MINYLLFIYIFLWPLILPVLCIVAVARAKRSALRKVVLTYAALIVVSAIPLMVQIQLSADHDLPFASLMFYPVAVISLALVLLARLALIRVRGGDPRLDA